MLIKGFLPSSISEDAVKLSEEMSCTRVHRMFTKDVAASGFPVSRYDWNKLGSLDNSTLKREIYMATLVSWNLHIPRISLTLGRQHSPFFVLNRR